MLTHKICKQCHQKFNINSVNKEDELANILIYSILFADSIKVDINEIISNKLLKNEIKYPISKSFGSNKKYNEL
ncbi:MazG-like family protein [Peribacillus simplex]|uniref:MazG-like family protein n=1 Tax=Peribacillus simplex TaxID=1478 RepID=UPI0007777038|nr:MazG-like family protein [Peribacillus simplex]